MKNKNKKHVIKGVWFPVVCFLGQLCAVGIGFLSNFFLDPPLFAQTNVSLQGVELETHVPNAHNPLLMKARQLLDKGNWDDAIPLYREYLKQDPKSLIAVMGLSTALTHSGNRSQSLEILVEAVNNLSTGEARIYGENIKQRIDNIYRLFFTNQTFQTFQDGLNLLFVSKFSAAKEKFKKALAEEPDNGEVLIRLGQAALADNDVQSGVKYFKTAKKLNPFCLSARMWLGRALQLSNAFAQAVEEFEAVHKENPQSEWTVVWMAEALFSMGQSNVATMLLDSDVKQHPLHVMSLVTSAKLRLQLKQGGIENLWVAKKNLQLALNRLDTYYKKDLLESEGEFWLDQRKSSTELSLEIQRLMQSGLVKE